MLVQSVDVIDSKAFVTNLTHGTRRGRARQIFFDPAPIDIGEERFDVFITLSGLVVEQEGMFPDIHDHNRLEA